MAVKLHIVHQLRKTYLGTGAFLSHYLGGLYNRVDEHHIFLMASGLAFSLVVCSIPLVLIVFSALGMVLQQPTLQDQIATFIEHAIPYADYADIVKEMVFTRVDEFVGHQRLAGVIGVTGLLLAATSLFSSMRTTLNKVYNITPHESILLSKLRDLGLIVLVLVYFLLSTAIIPAIRLMERFTFKHETVNTVVQWLPEGLALHLLSFVLIFTSFMIVYLAVPHQRPHFKMILVSALSAALLWQVAQQAFGYYVSHFVTLKRIYGAYALFLAVGFWIYYTAIVFIIGAEIGQLYRERKEAASKPVVAS